MERGGAARHRLCQFGDNFKQLNAAVHKLVEWQENYRRQVEHGTRMLRAISDSLKNSDKTLAEISRRNKTNAANGYSQGFRGSKAIRNVCAVY